MPKTTRIVPGRTAVNSQFQDSNDWNYLDQDDYLRILVYGRTATGKTTFSSTAPGPIRWLVCSGGNRPGELRSVNTPELRKKISPKVVRHSDDVMEVVEAAKSGNYSTIVLDHLTGLVNLIVTEVKSLKEIPIGFGQSKAQDARGMVMVTEQEWGFIGAEGIKMLKALLSLPAHCIIIAQQLEKKPRKKENMADFEGEDVVMPFVGGQATPMIMAWLNPAVDYILGTFIRPKYQTIMRESGMKGQPAQEVTERVPGKFEYCARTGPHDIFTTKFRKPRGTGELPECIVDPTFDRVLALSRGQGGSK